jgi:Uma2 family endonuclease
MSRTSIHGFPFTQKDLTQGMDDQAPARPYANCDAAVRNSPWYLFWVAEARQLGRMTYAEYLALERGSEVKHEYVNGQVYAMAGGTPDHGRLAMNVGRLLGAALAGKPCAVFSSDVRVRIESTGRSTYPDLTVVCGRLARAGDDADAIVNPIVLVEVLSDSTEASDRGDKFAHYRRLPSLREYVLVSQTTPRIEVFRRREGGDWVLSEAGPGEAARLESIDVALPVDEVYHDPLRSEPTVR